MSELLFVVKWRPVDLCAKHSFVCGYFKCRDLFANHAGFHTLRVCMLIRLLQYTNLSYLMSNVIL